MSGKQPGWPGQRVVQVAQPQEAHRKAWYPVGAGLVHGPLVATRPGQHVVQATQTLTTQLLGTYVDTNALGEKVSVGRVRGQGSDKDTRRVPADRAPRTTSPLLGMEE